jgi:predicted small integral membrane protein
MTGNRWPIVYGVTALVLLGILAAIVLNVPRTASGEFRWTDQYVTGFWMAWSFPVALFFWVIGTTLAIFTILAIRFPETPRVGILRIETTRGDRLFITLLGSAFVNLAWLGMDLGPQWYALGPCAVLAIIVFRWV